MKNLEKEKIGSQPLHESKQFSVTIQQCYVDELGYEYESYEFNTIHEALNFKGYKHHRDNYYISEWDYSELDGYGVPDLIGSCSLALFEGHETDMPL